MIEQIILEVSVIIMLSKAVLYPFFNGVFPVNTKAHKLISVEFLVLQTKFVYLTFCISIIRFRSLLKNHVPESSTNNLYRASRVANWGFEIIDSNLLRSQHRALRTYHGASLL